MWQGLCRCLMCDVLECAAAYPATAVATPLIVPLAPVCTVCREEAGLDQAVALDGTNLLGRRIRVGYAQPKKE